MKYKAKEIANFSLQFYEARGVTCNWEMRYTQNKPALPDDNFHMGYFGITLARATQLTEEQKKQFEEFCRAFLHDRFIVKNMPYYRK